MIESIKTRMPGGYFYERIRMLKTCSFLENPLLHNYLEYCKCAYWKGGKNCTKSALFNSGTDYVYLEDIKFPKLEGKDIGTFWCEFPDVFLPYMLEKWGGRNYQFETIDALMVEGPYEIDSNVSICSGDIVIDCGANIGLFSAIASKKGAEVYAFEPDEDIIRKYLKKTADFNPNITIVNRALSDGTYRTFFAKSTNNLGGGNLTDDEKNADFSVETITLDEWCENNNIKKIDYIKADIEGAERKLLQGAKRVLREMAPKLSICTYHLPDDKVVLEKIVRDANPQYEIKHDYKKMYAYIP